METKYINTKSLRFHYREAGTGAVVVLLHPSPRSGKMFEALGQILAPYCRVIIPDLPGFGASEGIPTEIKTLYDVVPYFDEFFEALSLDQFSLYGSATGAQLGIAYALRYPQKVQHLLLDNCAHFSEEEYQSIVSQYFIDITPKADGSHLSVLWQHVTASMEFFPWYDPREENRIASQLPPPEVLTETVKDYLIAGPRYHEMYRAAFLHERAKNVQALQVQTTLFRWEGSILLRWIDDLLKYPMPANINIVATGKSIKERYEAIIEYIRNTAMD
jgi:pimeloyl-ACP methyl ester carboxylesterase